MHRPSIQSILDHYGIEVEQHDRTRVQYYTHLLFGEQFSTQYVGAVMRGDRESALVEKVACRYFTEKGRLHQRMLSWAKHKKD